MADKTMMMVEVIEAGAILLLAFYLFKLYREIGTMEESEE